MMKMAVWLKMPEQEGNSKGMDVSDKKASKLGGLGQRMYGLSSMNLAGTRNPVTSTISKRGDNGTL